MSLSYSNDKEMLSGEPLPLTHFFVVTLKDVIFEKCRYFATAFGVFLSFMQVSSCTVVHPFEISKIPWACIYSYITISMISINFIIDFENLLKLKNRFCWSLNSAGPEVKERIFNIGRQQDKVALAGIMTLIIMEPHFLTFESIRQHDYTSAVLRKYVPVSEVIYLNILICWIIITTPIFVAWPMTIIYFVWHHQFQVLMLAEFTKEISTDFNNYNGNLVHDKYYQEIIWKRLKFVLKRHAEALGSHRELIAFSKGRLTSLLVGTFGTALAVGSCVDMLTNDNVIAPALLFSCFIIFLEMLICCAQNYEDRYIEIYDAALQIPWYEWNIKNRRAYLLLVQKSAQVVHFDFFHTHVNRAFQMKLLENLYTIGYIIFHVY